MAKLTYRLARAEDIPALAHLINGAYRGDSARRGWTTEADLIDGQRVDEPMLAAILAEPGAILLLAERDQVEACVYLKRGERRAYLGMLTVRPELQAAGVGRQMLAAAEEWVTKVWGERAIEMTVIQKRAELLQWYERRGYRPTGRTEPFPYGDERYGVPRTADLEFIVLEKRFP